MSKGGSGGTSHSTAGWGQWEGALLPGNDRKRGNSLKLCQKFHCIHLVSWHWGPGREVRGPQWNPATFSSFCKTQRTLQWRCHWKRGFFSSEKLYFPVSSSSSVAPATAHPSICSITEFPGNKSPLNPALKRFPAAINPS